MTSRIPAAIAALFLGTSSVFAADGAATDAAPTALELWEQDRSVVLDSDGISLDEFLWVARPIVVFADTPADPRFVEQMELLAAGSDDLAERDVVVIIDTDPSTPTAVRRQLRPRGFMVAVVGKDGGVKLRKPLPWSVREFSRSIDKMPLRQREIREGNE